MSWQTSRAQKRAPYLLGTHLALVAFYAFVLPFICFGAMATPGHPHARPHFVFTDPPRIPEALPSTVSGAEWLLLNAGAWLCTPPDGASALSNATTNDAYSTTKSVAGRSAPATLVLFSLLLFHVGQVILLAGLHPKGFTRTIGGLIPQMPELPPPCPPPRLTIALA